MTGSRRLTGIGLVALSAVMWSTAGLFVRMAQLDTATLIAWRSAFSFLTLAALTLVRTRGRVVRNLAGLGWPEGVFALVTAASSIAYVAALQLTTVANVMIVYASLPFMVTAMAFVWLGERVTTRFLVAGAVALGGVAVTAGAGASARDLLGIGAAVVMTATFAVQLVYTKRHPSMVLTVPTALAAALCVPIMLPFAHEGLPAPMPLLACALYGALTTGLAYMLVLEGGRLISSGEAGLVSLLDVVLGPFWVWLAYAERPSSAALVGGLAVLTSVTWYLATAAADPAGERRTAP